MIKPARAAVGRLRLAMRFVEVDEALLAEKDTLILCGHGYPSGLLSPQNRGEQFLVSERNVRFIKASIDPGDAWIGKTISEIAMPSGSIIALVIRDGETMVPRGDIEILLGDKLIICAESATEGMLEDVKEVVLGRSHPWNKQKIRDLDISRQTFIVLVERDGRTMKPDGELELIEGDKVLIYTKENLRKYMKEPLF